MRACVAATFPKFTTSFEGRTTWLYLDVKGLVTCGTGNLVDPIESALALPWCIDGDPTQPADVDTVAAQWHAVKDRQDMREAGGGAFAKLTTIRLTEDAVDTLLQDRAHEMEYVLRQRFAGYDDLPADAQLGLLSMSWAMGPNFGAGYPLFCAAVNAGDYASAALQCQMNAVGNPGLVPRNIADRKLFAAAADGGDPDELHWP
jgi:GH24 family phage-related lysozyme (muramidase)